MTRKKASTTAQAPSVLRPTVSGWWRRGGGRAGYREAPDMFRGTTAQTCGLYPFIVGAGAPIVGVPVGQHLRTGATVCADPISYFQSGLIRNPSLYVEGLPGLGKTTLVERMLIGLAAFGIQPLVLGDLRPDYIRLIKALGGQVISLGPGGGHLNPLDPGGAIEAASRLTGTRRAAVLADVHTRQVQTTEALITILRKGPLGSRESSILDTAVSILRHKHAGVPIYADLLQVLRDAPTELRQVALDRGSDERYRELTEDLEANLMSLAEGNSTVLADTFSQQTDEPMRMDRPVVFDVSGIDDAAWDRQAAVLTACWSTGFGLVNVAHELADAGLEPRRHYLVVMDELWRALRAGHGIVDRIDALTRLNRTTGVGTVMISHTMSDLEALRDQADAKKAIGFVERAGMVILGGLPRREMPMLEQVMSFSKKERDLLASWSVQPNLTEQETVPPGRGRFLLKIGGRHGIPFNVGLTDAERRTSNTNTRWDTHSGQQEGPTT